MDTTQKNREEIRERRQRPVSSEAPPVSAQQSNGAVRTAQEQRETAKKRPQLERKAPAKRTGTSSKKKEASKRGLSLLKSQKPDAKADPEDISARKRAYGNSKPKKTPVTRVKDSLQDRAKRKAERMAKEGKKPNRPKQPTPAIIYTQPAAFNRSRLAVQLLTVVAVVLALVLGLSVFFKVEHIYVSGAEVYSEWAIREASGLQGGENLLTFSRPRAGALIKANLPYVDTVRFGIKLPDTVNIIVKEDDVVYGIKDQTGTWWLMNSEGRVVEMGNDAKASNHTQILGVALENPVADQRGVAQEAAPMQTEEGGEIIPVTVTGAQRLTAVLHILQALEANGIVGEVASVDVTRMEDIILWYGSRYQVNLGDSVNLDYKITCMKDAILQMNEWQSGILDISFTIWPNQVSYTPFS